jgi:hypothetical protein
MMAAVRQRIENNARSIQTPSQVIVVDLGRLVVDIILNWAAIRPIWISRCGYTYFNQVLGLPFAAVAPHFTNLFRHHLYADSNEIAKIIFLSPFFFPFLVITHHTYIINLYGTDRQHQPTTP